MSGEGPPGPKPSILSLYAFDPDGASSHHPVWGDLLARRRKVFGAHSLLSYDEPVEFVRGEGVWLYDRHGTPFLDAYNNVPSVGHAHPRVVEAISRQAAAVNTNTRYLDDVVCSYAEKLLSTFPPSLSNVVFTCTGSESVDLALRLMRNASGADGFVVTRFAYHGNTRASSEISPSYGAGAAPADHVRAVPPPDGYRRRGKDIGESFAEDVRQAIRDLRSHGIGFAGFVADTIFSSDGVFADPPGFLSKTAEVVRSEGGLFLADEVQPGLGRTGDSMWGFQRHGVLPDLVALGKPMGNGLPVAGVVVRPDILGDFLRRTGYFNTFGGNSVCCAAGNAVLEIVESERLVENARLVGSRLIRGLSDLSRKYPLIGDVRGAGLYIGVELVKDPCSMEPASEEARRIVNGFRAKHVLIGATGQSGHILKIRPPLVFSRENAEQFLSVADEVLESIAK